MRAVRRPENAMRMASAAPTTASVTASSFSRADCLRIWIAPVVSSTTTAPTMSSPTKIGCAADRIATPRSCPARHCVELTPISARSIWLRTGRDSLPTGMRGAGTTRAATGFNQLTSERAASGSSRLPERPRTRDLPSTTHIRVPRCPMIERKRSISSEGT